MHALNVVERVENVVAEGVVVVLVRQRHAVYPRYAKRRIFCWHEYRLAPDGSMVGVVRAMGHGVTACL